jgi:hypothetical protein
MSRALERLRDMFGDPLLVRTGRGYERTVRGERVLRELESLSAVLFWGDEQTLSLGVPANRIWPTRQHCGGYLISFRMT